MTCEVTCEELAAFAAGDLSAERMESLRVHTVDCQECARRLKALGRVDDSVRKLARVEPPTQIVLNVRRALSKASITREPDIMTLQDVADFLRVSLEDLYETMDELPAFELAGRILVRRAKLLEWIERRERSYRRQTIRSEIARGFAGVA